MKNYTIFLFIVALILIIGGIYVAKKEVVAPTAPTSVACTMEAKLCPDGSAVGRQGPDCEFAPCPVAQKDDTDLSDWKTYTNTKYGYIIKYPTIWELGQEQSIVDGTNNIPSLISIRAKDYKNNTDNVSIMVKPKGCSAGINPSVGNINVGGVSYPAYPPVSGPAEDGTESFLTIPIKNGNIWYCLTTNYSPSATSKEVLNSFSFNPL